MNKTIRAATLNSHPSQPDPYSWLKGSDDYELPDEILAGLEGVPEKGSIRALASLVEELFENTGPHMGRVLWNPEYSALSLAERKFI